MDELAIRNLNDWERKKLKRKIIDTIKDKETAKRIMEQEALLNVYKNEIEKNKKNRSECIEENQKRKLKINEFQKRMIEYEFEGYVIELEIALLQKEIKTTKALHKRLNTLYLLLNFYDGMEVIVMKESNGEKKNLYQKDIESLFVVILLEEMKEHLEMNQKCKQLYMLINSIRNYTVDKKHKFYLDEERKKEIYANILEDHAYILEVEDNWNKIKEFQGTSYLVKDFFASISSVYEHLFKKEDLVCKEIIK